MSRRIGAVEYEKYIIPVAVVIGAYFILKNFNLFGGGAASANASGIDTSTASGVAASLSAAKATGDIATISQAQAAGLAAAIFNAGIDPVDQDTIQNSIIQANTLTDLLMIVQAFGTKQAGGVACSLFGSFASATCGTYNLNSWVAANLDQSHIASINSYLSNQGINYSF